MELRRAFAAKIDIVVHGIRVIRTKHPGQVSFPAAGFSAEAYPVRIVFSFQLVGSIPCFSFHGGKGEPLQIERIVAPFAPLKTRYTS